MWRPPELARVGMVTGALWSDVDGDGKKELVVVGEWMAPRVFGYRGGRLVELEHTGLEGLKGWWQTISAADLNGDGHEDLVLGNIGENFYLRPDHEHPVKLWVSDFDGNGTIDQFLTRTVGGRDVPVFLKREITEQFPALKKGNLKHSDYAKKAIQDLFAASVLAQARQLEFTYCASVVALGDGKGGFTVQPLPVPVQLSSVNAVLPIDLNADGRVDLVVGGNLFTFPPQFGRLDASYGEVLLGDGRGGFSCLDQRASGLMLKGQVRDIQPLSLKNQPCLLITQNDEVPLLYKINQRK